VHCARQHVLDVCQRVGGLHDISGLERRPELVQLLLKQVDAKGAAFDVRQRRLVHDWRAEQAVERRDVLQAARLGEWRRRLAWDDLHRFGGRGEEERGEPAMSHTWAARRLGPMGVENTYTRPDNLVCILTSNSSHYGFSEV
jgi:hypothetical protein